MSPRERKPFFSKDRLKEAGVRTTALIAIGAAGLGLTACGPSETKAVESPTPTASAPVTPGASETAPAPSSSETAGINQELPEKYLVTVEKYPTSAEAANALIAGPDMGANPPAGVFNTIMTEAGRNQSTTDAPSVPPEAIIALFGPEPAEGYPESVQADIAKWKKDYKQFQGLYFATMTSEEPFQCFYQLQVTSSNDHGIRGKYTQYCRESSVPGSRTKATDFEWSEWLNLTMAQRTDETTGQKVWYITEVRDGETIYE